MKKKINKRVKINKRKIIQLIAFMPFTIALIANYEVVTPLILISTALAGAFYCGYLCPFGFLQDIGIWLRKKFKLKKIELPAIIDKYLRYLRYLLYIGISLLSVDVLMGLLKYDPRSNLYLLLTGKTIGITMLISLLLFFIASIFMDRPFCKYFCIKGAFYGILSKLRVISIVRAENSCVNCGRCDRACPMGINVSTCAYVKSMDCVNCFECVKSCPVNKTLEVKMIARRDAIKKLLVIVLVGLCLWFYMDTEKEPESNVAVAEEVKEVEEDIVYYNGVGEGYNGPISVKVGYVEKKIYKIKVVNHQEDYEWYVKSKKPIIEAVIATQSTDVDIVSGATYTSNGLLEAIENAINKVE